MWHSSPYSPFVSASTWEEGHGFTPTLPEAAGSGSRVTAKEKSTAGLIRVPDAIAR